MGLPLTHSGPTSGQSLLVFLPEPIIGSTEQELNILVSAALSNHKTPWNKVEKFSPEEIR
jgi:hypothetical protein